MTTIITTLMALRLSVLLNLQTSNPGHLCSLHKFFNALLLPCAQIWLDIKQSEPLWNISLVRDHHPNLEGKTNEYICLYTYISLRAGRSLKVKVCLGFVELIFVLFRVVLVFAHVCFRVYLGLFIYG